MEAKHTPTPWGLKHGFLHVVLPMNEQFPRRAAIAKCDLSHGLGEAGIEDEANAAFIVRACNSHDALVWALKELYAQVRGECPSLLDEDSGGSTGLDSKISDALALAGETP